MKKFFVFLGTVSAVISGFFLYRHIKWCLWIKWWAKRGQTNHEMGTKWLEKMQNGDSIERYFVDHNIKKIAIYGCGYLGRLLLRELRKTGNVEVAFGIDTVENPICAPEDITIYDVDDFFPEKVDAIVVTPAFDYDKVYKKLSEKTDDEILSFEEVVFY